MEARSAQRLLERTAKNIVLACNQCKPSYCALIAV